MSDRAVISLCLSAFVVDQIFTTKTLRHEGINADDFSFFVMSCHQGLK
jgi:hypothetical protein